VDGSSALTTRLQKWRWFAQAIGLRHSECSRSGIPVPDKIERDGSQRVSTSTKRACQAEGCLTYGNGLPLLRQQLVADGEVDHAGEDDGATQHGADGDHEPGRAHPSLEGA
jgi:hypothetical protein